MFSELKVQEIFGQSSSVPLNYVERETVDGVFRRSLTNNKLIVLHGNSKQGKSSLLKHSLEKDSYVIVYCNNKWDIGRLNAQILRRAGFEINTSTYKTIDGKTKVLASFKSSKKNIPQEYDVSEQAKQTFQSLELDPYDPNDIIDALKLVGFNKYIILEDFQYLLETTKKDFSIELKMLHETSNLTFIIAGVWEEEKKIEEFNPNLTGRVCSINTNIWSEDELMRVIIRGEKLLNIRMDNRIREEILNWCVNDVFNLQEMCLEVCLRNNITEAQEFLVELTNDIDVFELTTNWNE